MEINGKQLYYVNLVGLYYKFVLATPSKNKEEIPKEIRSVFVEYLTLKSVLFMSYWVEYDLESGLEKTGENHHITLPEQILEAVQKDNMGNMFGHGATWYPVGDSIIGGGDLEVEGYSFDSWVDSAGFRLRGIPHHADPELLK